MDMPGLKLTWIAMGLQLSVGGYATAQQLPPMDDLTGLVQEAERLPAYQVEVLVFAYNAFDPTEEQFRYEPRNDVLDAVIPPHNEPQSPYASPAQEQPGDLGQRDAFDPLRPLQEPFPEEPSISQQLIDSLLSLEEDPAALGAPIGGLEDRDPGRAAPQASPAQDEGPFGQPSSLDEALAGDQAPAVEPFRYRILAPDELQLTAAYRTLDRLDAYTPLVHGGWVQEGLPEERARAFHLSRLGALNPVGTIRLHLSRFLHVTVELSYQGGRAPEPPRPPVAGFGPGSYGPTSYGLEEITLPPRYELRAQRRARSGELHYFDHPAFGVIVIVRPEPEALDEQEATIGPAA